MKWEGTSNPFLGWAGASPSIADYMIGPDKVLGTTGIHLDTSQGGTNDIKDTSVVEASGGATITFTRPMGIFFFKTNS